MNQKGIGIIEVMIAAALLGLVSVFTSSMMSQMAQAQRRVHQLNALQGLRNQIIASIINPGSWGSTLNENDSRGIGLVGSLVNPLMQSPAPNFDVDGNRIPHALPIVMASDGSYDQNYRQDNDVLIDTTNATNGYSADGSKCNEFGVDDPGAGDGNDRCPIQFQVHWLPTCPNNNGNGPCLTPGVRYSISLTWKPGPALSKIVFNAKNYSLPMTQLSNPRVTEDSLCTSFGGVWNDQNQMCDYNRGLCGDGKVLKGHNPDGTLNCADMFSDPSQTECPEGQRISGFNPDGSARCTFNAPQINGQANVCGNGLMMTGINLDGTPHCSFIGGRGNQCPPGQVMTQIGLDGTPVCSWLLRLVTANPIGVTQCGAGKVIDFIYEDGTYLCKDDL